MLWNEKPKPKEKFFSTLPLRFFFFSYVSLSRVFPFSSSLRRAIYILCETRAEHGYKELLTAIKVLKVEVVRRGERITKQSFAYLKWVLAERVDEPIVLEWRTWAEPLFRLWLCALKFPPANLSKQLQLLTLISQACWWQNLHEFAFHN